MNAAFDKLKALARNLKELEKTTFAYDSQRLNVKYEFEQAYRAFLDLGLIEDLGYGIFFKD